MLKAIHPLLGSDLLWILSSLGHGDEIAIVDANFPATRLAHRLVPMPGVDTAALLVAILTVLPLDDTMACPVSTMRAAAGTDAATTAIRSIRVALDAAAGTNVGVAELERFAFYERAANAFAIVSTGEFRPYGNVILTTGTVSGF